MYLIDDFFSKCVGCQGSVIFTEDYAIYKPDALVFDFRQDTIRQATASDHLPDFELVQLIEVKHTQRDDFEWRSNPLTPYGVQRIEQLIQSRLINRCVLRRLLRSIFVENASLVVSVDKNIAHWLLQLCEFTHLGFCGALQSSEDSNLDFVRTTTRLVSCPNQRHFERQFEAKYPGCMLPNVMVLQKFEDQVFYEKDDIGYDAKRQVSGKKCLFLF